MAARRWLRVRIETTNPSGRFQDIKRQHRLPNLRSALNSFQVLIPDPIHPDGVTRLRERFVVDTDSGGDADALHAAFAAADAVVVRNLAIPAQLLKAAPKLKVIAKHGAGVDNIDLDAATRLGIIVANVPGGNADAVAEATVALMLAAIRRVPEVHDLVQRGRYSARFELQFSQLSERTLGLVGIGNIGTRVANICSRGFRMRVVAFDPGLSAAEIEARGANKADSLDSLLAVADVVSLHLPLTDDTYHLIGREQLERMKSSAILINAARGPLVDEIALATALRAGVIAGVGLDVFEIEPPSLDNPILTSPHAVLSPHTAGNTIDAARYLAVSSANIVIDVLSGRRPANLLNAAAWDRRRC